MDLKDIILSEIRQRQITYMWTRKVQKKKQDYKKSRLVVMGAQYRGGGV